MRLALRRASFALAMAKTVVRKPLGKREAHIIKRRKVAGGLPVTKTAEIEERHKKTLYTVFSGKASVAKRGPKKKLSAKAVNQQPL